MSLRSVAIWGTLAAVLILLGFGLQSKGTAAISVGDPAPEDERRLDSDVARYDR